MSAPIGSSSSRASGLAGAVAARPQMQSRRVSLKLGPLGITYSTDRVLWTGEAAQAAAMATESAVASAQAEPANETVNEPLAQSTGQPGSESASQSLQAQQAQQTQTEAQQAGRTFSQEMLEAWRKQVEQRVQAPQAYGPGVARGSAAGRDQAAGAAAEATQEVAEEAAGGMSCAASTAASSAEPGAEPGATRATTSSAMANAAASAVGDTVSGVSGVRPGQGSASPETESRAAQASAPVSRVRRAISAYLACAQSFRSTGPMLSAVA